MVHDNGAEKKAGARTQQSRGHMISKYSYTGGKPDDAQLRRLVRKCVIHAGVNP
jgi:hypothetical protein